MIRRATVEVNLRYVTKKFIIHWRVLVVGVALWKRLSIFLAWPHRLPAVISMLLPLSPKASVLQLVHGGKHIFIMQSNISSQWKLAHLHTCTLATQRAILLSLCGNLRVIRHKLRILAEFEFCKEGDFGMYHSRGWTVTWDFALESFSMRRCTCCFFAHL
jgi:hypothetical protein